MKNEEIAIKIYRFPKWDPIEIFGLNLNNEVPYNYQNSSHLLQNLVKHFQKIERLEAKEALLSHFLGSNKNASVSLRINRERSMLAFKAESEKMIHKRLKSQFDALNKLLNLTNAIQKSLGNTFNINDVKILYSNKSRIRPNMDIALAEWINLKREENKEGANKISYASDFSELVNEKYNLCSIKKKNLMSNLVNDKKQTIKLSPRIMEDAPSPQLQVDRRKRAITQFTTTLHDNLKKDIKDDEINVKQNI